MKIDEATTALEKLGFTNVSIEKIGWVHVVEGDFMGLRLGGALPVLDDVFAQVADQAVKTRVGLVNASRFNVNGTAAAVEAPPAPPTAPEGPRTTEPPPATRQSALAEGDGSLVTELAGDNGGGENAGDNGEGGGDAEGGGK